MIRHTIFLPAVRLSRPYQGWQSEVLHTCQAGEQQNDGECCALRRHGGQRLQQLVGAARWFDTQGSGGKSGGWRLATFVANCDARAAFMCSGSHLERNSSIGGIETSARACPVVDTWRPTGASKNLTGLLHGRKWKLQKAQVQSPVLVRSQACPKECESYQLSIATHPRNTHVCSYEVAAGKQRSICVGHAVSIPASACCGVKPCARPRPMPLQPVCRHCRCRLATAVLWRCRHY